MSFTEQERAACSKLVALALEEDLGSAGDLTSQAIVPAELEGRAVFVARAQGVVAGLPAVELVCTAVDKRLSFKILVHDGMTVDQGSPLAVLAGPIQSLLAA